ncbi:competence/damage-inducible protein A [Promicromonospora sp. CA-289599]|uniref:competence/damage-inducible protein A n=1 Tax=Promicromonospora sp. CA-289599 TaxID=3240014 RepID=UPI003D93099D
MTVALLVVGNEILDGSTTDTNSSWVCRQIAGRGAGVVRTAVVPDDPREIAQGLDFLLQAGPKLIVTLGGLGPTRDDLTVEAVASYFGIETTEHADAVRIVNERYAALAAKGRVADATSPAALRARAKMTRLPEGGIALDNQVGAAPGVWLDVREDLAILNLPGVPSELKYIVLNEAGTHLERVLGVGYFRSATIVTSTNDESELSGALVAFDRKYDDPTVYLKSRAKRFGKDVRMQVTISVRGSGLDDVTDRLTAAIENFRTELSDESIEVQSVTFDD